MLKTDMVVDGLILSKLIIDNILDRFFSSQRTIPCMAPTGEKIGDVKNMTLENDIVYFHVDFTSENNYQYAKPVVEYAARVLQVRLSDDKPKE